MSAMAHSPSSALSRSKQRYWTLSATVLEALALCAGSTAAFAGMVTFVLTWAILGAFYSDQQIWQIAMQVGFLWQLRLTAAFSTTVWSVPYACFL